MKKLFAGAVAGGLMLSLAAAGDLESACVEYVEANGGDTSGCSCLADASDDAMTAELLAVESEADLEGLSDASKEALASCFPE